MTVSNGRHIIGQGCKIANLYHMDIIEPITCALPAMLSRSRSWYKWHCALGHLNKNQLQEMYSKKIVDGMDVDESSTKDFSCELCIKAKHPRHPFPNSAEARDLAPGNLTVCNTWGPARTQSLQHNTYVITYTDIRARHTTLFSMKARSSSLNRFKQYEAMFKTQFR